MKGLEEVDFLARSANRLRVLEALTNEPMDLRDTKDALGIPRTTVQRNLGDLKEKGWVKEVREGYKATSLGEMILDAFLDLVEITESAEELSAFMKWVDCAHVDTSRLKAANVTTPKQSNPHAPLKRFTELLGNSSDVRVVTPSIFPSFIEVHQRMASADGVEVQAILTRDAFDVFERDYSKELRDIMDGSGNEILVYPENVPFTLAILDDSVGMLAYDDDGMPRALLESSSGDAQEWAREQYGGYLESSKRMELNPMRA